MKILIALPLVILMPFKVDSQAHKAPAYPLITHDPYFSIWSFSDNINETPTKHWTGKNHAIIGLIKVDGNVYSFLGSPEPNYKDVAATAEGIPQEAKFTTEAPASNWSSNDFNDASWSWGTLPLSSEANNWTT